MPILLPNLDDRRWADLVNEGRALIPLYAPEWTDQNAHDPGVTLIELLAWFAEMDVYRLNRITDRAKLKFLSLVGIHPEPPRPASTLLSFSLLTGNPLRLPEKLEFTGLDPFGQATIFRTLDPVTVHAAGLAAVQVKDAGGFHDLTDRWQRGLGFGVFGDIPQTGVELYLGFNAALPPGEPFSLFFTFSNRHANREERLRILEEVRGRAQDCSPLIPKCRGARSASSPAAELSPLPNPGVRLDWELAIPSGTQTSWVPLPVVDDTRMFTLDGSATIKPSAAGAMLKLGQVNAALCYFRVRLAAGAYDSPPTVQNLAVNAVRGKQCASVANITWSIAAGVTTPPPPTGPVGLQLAFDTDGQISALSFVAAAPHFTVFNLTPASSSAAGSLSIEAFQSCGDGTPSQQATLPGAPVKQSSLNLFTFESGAWRSWRLRSDLDSSNPGDADFLLEPTTGIVTFGDGNQGRVVPPGARIIATYCSTRAEAGNLRAGSVRKLNDSPHNCVLLKAECQDTSDRLLTVNPVPASGGTAAETLDLAIARAIGMLAQPQRAVTLADYEQLALETPGTDVARAKAWADLHPDFPCFEAPGVVTVVILPNMPVGTPTPSPALLSSVSSYLNRLRIIGSRIEVRGPVYRSIAVQAQVQPASGASKTALQQRVVDALNAFLNPLTGGPGDTGWPFGRDVYRAEMLQVIDQVPGIDYVTRLALFVDGCLCDPQCGNVCLSPTELVASGAHNIEVL